MPERLLKDAMHQPHKLAAVTPTSVKRQKKDRLAKALKANLKRRKAAENKARPAP